MFAIHGLPSTPTSGERFDGPGNSVTRTELAALFAVIGTPSWRCIESVANPAWRRYLRKITGRCVKGTLRRGIGYIMGIRNVFAAANGVTPLAQPTWVLFIVCLMHVSYPLT